MSPQLTAHLTEFLQKDLSVSQEAISLVLRQEISSLNHLPVILWKFGLVSLPQVNRIFEWIEAYPAV
ncbi:DUF2949 domain-containing protein [Acaryochloris thomasi]|uniref:DUF2949 domain-containing protein n=1 Tax=Acaryochloris thomasi TaxID=2929456 RepID=UPI000DA6623B|nr:DUF2949 domain-containing protein [Acaryochloris thomasi]